MVDRARFGAPLAIALMPLGNLHQNDPIKWSVFGIGSTFRVGSNANQKTPSRSSAYEPRNLISPALKIRVSTVRFRPWPPDTPVRRKRAVFIRGPAKAYASHVFHGLISQDRPWVVPSMACPQRSVKRTMSECWHAPLALANPQHIRQLSDDNPGHSVVVRLASQPGLMGPRIAPKAFTPRFSLGDFEDKTVDGLPVGPVPAVSVAGIKVADVWRQAHWQGTQQQGTQYTEECRHGQPGQVILGNGNSP